MSSFDKLSRECCIIGMVSNETNEDVRMFTWRIYSSRDLDTLLHKVEDELNKHWKNAALYTLATKDWEMWELLLGVNWQVRVNRITIAWETVTSETDLWSVISLFASLITPGGVNGNLCGHLAHQTAGETIECHSCNQYYDLTRR